MHAHLRVARATDHMDEIVRFYSEGLGFEIIGSFRDHDGFDGVMLGHRDSGYHLEFTKRHGHAAGRAPGPENLLVFYVSREDDWAASVARMRGCGYLPVQPLNPYWGLHGETFEDADGYRVVLHRGPWR